MDMTALDFEKTMYHEDSDVGKNYSLESEQKVSAAESMSKVDLLALIKELGEKQSALENEKNAAVEEKNGIEKQLSQLKQENESTNKKAKKEIDDLKKENGDISKDRDNVAMRYDTLTLKLREHVECPVCLDVPTSGPVYSCPNGHFVCSKCKSADCPTCRGRMFNNKSLLAVTVIENIEHKCKNESCDKILPLEDYQLHLKSCPHRTVLCPAHAQLCGKRMELSKVFDHILKQCSGSHNKDCDYLIRDSFPKFLSYPIGKVRDQLIKGSALCCQGVHFYLGLEKINGSLMVTLQLFGNTSECQDYRVSFGLGDSDDKEMDRDHVQIFKGEPLPIDLEPQSRKVNGLMVGTMQLENIAKAEENDIKNEDLIVGILINIRKY